MSIDTPAQIDDAQPDDDENETPNRTEQVRN